MADAAAHAGSPPAAEGLRALCASAAASIREECDDVLRLHKDLVTKKGSSSSSRRGKDGCAASGVVGVGGAAEGGCRQITDMATTGATANDSGIRPGLADCGEPLVHLLSRQASRLVALFEAARPSHPLLRSPVPVGPAVVSHDDRAPDAMRPCAHGMPQLQHGCGATRCSEAAGDELLSRRLDDIMSIAYSKFYAYPYKDLPLCWRQLYTDASMLKFGYLLLSSPQQILGLERDGADVTLSGQHATDAAEQATREMANTLDLALILAGAGGLSRGRKWIDTAFDLFEDACTRTIVGDTMSNAKTYGFAGMAGADNTTTPPAKRPRLGSSARTPEPGSPGRTFSTFEPFTPPIRNPVCRVPAHVMDMAAFQQYLDRADPRRGPGPMILTGLLEDWPARGCRSWNNPDYLLSRTFGGRRLVPVEIGRSYVDEGWGQRMVTFGEFLRDYIDPASVSYTTQERAAATAIQGQDRRRTPAAAEQAGDRSDPLPHPPLPPPAATEPAAAPLPPPPVAYLAQHQLLLQLPRLRNDILIPDHCYTAAPPHPSDRSQDQPELESPLLNAWLGPPGTITPLHTDPYHNLLAQVVGRKYVRLYPPVLETGGGAGPESSGSIMRARGREGGIEMGNTSAWDVGVIEGWDPDPDDDGDDDDGAGCSRARPSSNTDTVGGGAGAEDAAAAAARQFREVPFFDCILEPGDTLYIPIGWWHYVRGLSVSFSVSFWWNGGKD